MRSRQYVVEDFTPSEFEPKVRLACLEDDALGETLELFWEREIDRQILGNSSWEEIADSK